MRLNGQVTAALLVTALAAFGCSNGVGTSQKVQEPEHSARTTPVSLNNEFSTRPALDKGIGDVTPKVAGPVSYADGEKAYHAGNYTEAISLFEQYTEQKPNNAWGHFMLGLSAWKGGDPVKAEMAFSDALRLDPDHVKSLVNLSRVQIEQKRHDEAVVNLTHAGDIDPNSADVQRLLGRIYRAQGQTDEAVAAYRRAIALNEKDAWSMNNLGLVFIETGRAADALPLLANAVGLRKDVATFHNNLGMALEQTGRFSAAAGEYSAALAGDPGYAKAKQNLERVDLIKTDGEEPFDLEATAKRFVEQIQTTANDAAARQ
jgi:tetratricopeptide (TPR) repeat protein